MAVDISRQNAKGGDPQFDTGALRGVREERGIVTGIVKANVHPSHNGVIRIWVPSFSTDPNDKSQYRTVRYCTPYYSRVDNQLQLPQMFSQNFLNYQIEDELNFFSQKIQVCLRH